MTTVKPNRSCILVLLLTILLIACSNRKASPTIVPTASLLATTRSARPTDVPASATLKANPTIVLPSSTLPPTVSHTPETRQTPTRRLATASPTRQPTDDSPFGQMVIAPDLALLYEKALWDNSDDMALTHTEIDGCKIESHNISERPHETQIKEIGGFEYEFYDDGEQAYYLTFIAPSGERGLLMVSASSETQACYTAAETVLANLHLIPGIVQSEICPWAPPTRLKVGDKVRLLTTAWLRSEPRWAEETKLERIQPAENQEITILDGPVCAIYPHGEYRYWQIYIMPGDVTAWFAEGDMNEYFLQPSE